MSDLPDPDQTRRRHIASRPITLADGRAWGFAEPTTLIMPIIGRDGDIAGRPIGSIAIRSTFGYPLEVSRPLEALKLALENGSAEGQHEAFHTLASAMLRRAHEIDQSSASALLCVSAEDLPRLVHEVVSVALGWESLAASQPLNEEIHD
jgi:hypothetical protein